jgi:hypothetical protein
MTRADRDSRHPMAVASVVVPAAAFGTDIDDLIGH